MLIALPKKYPDLEKRSDALTRAIGGQRYPLVLQTRFGEHDYRVESKIGVAFFMKSVTLVVKNKVPGRSLYFLRTGDDLIRLTLWHSRIIPY